MGAFFATRTWSSNDKKGQVSKPCIACLKSNGSMLIYIIKKNHACISSRKVILPERTISLIQTSQKWCCNSQSIYLPMLLRNWDAVFCNIHCTTVSILMCKQPVAPWLWINIASCNILEYLLLHHAFQRHCSAHVLFWYKFMRSLLHASGGLGTRWRVC